MLCKTDSQFANLCFVQISSDFELDTIEWLTAILILFFSFLFLLLYCFKLLSKSNSLEKKLAENDTLLVNERQQLKDAFFKSENQLIDVVNNFPIGCFIQLEGNFALVNSTLCEYLGSKSQDDFLGKRILDFVHPDSHEEIKKRIHFLNDRKIAFKDPLLSRFIRLDGLEIWSHTTAIPIVYKGKNGALVYFENVSEKRNIEVQLKNAGSTSEAVLNSLSASICVLNEKGIITSVNRNWRAFAENESGDAQTRSGVGMNYLEVCAKSAASGDALAEQVLQGINNVLNGNVSHFNIEYPCHSPKEKRWFVMNVVPLENDELGVVISHQNTTEIKLSELEKQESQRRFVNAFEHAPIGMAVVSLNGKILKANPAFCFLLGYNVEDLLMKFMEDLSFHKEYMQELELTKRMKRHELANSEMDRKFICKSGDIITCRLILSMVLDDQEQPSYFIYQFLDITENVKYLNSIEEQNKVLKEITWMQSHVVRAPLARLMGLISALEESEVSEFPHEEVRKEVLNSANELDEIIREISNKAQRVNDLQ
jgi:PAS domain S-box-containing protein